VAALAYSHATPFPRHAALLPVLGALAVIRGGAPAARWSPARVMTPRPVQFLGDISYSVYLWHWPLIVLPPSSSRPTAPASRSPSPLSASSRHG
jgi:peptidoglycan/LPS O-acetylase OafA/YrhL